MIEATDITVIFGQRGSGKSDMGKAISNIWRRRIVIDSLGEWKKSDGMELVTSSFDTAAAYLERKIGSENLGLVFQFDVDSNTELKKQTFNALLRLIWKRGKLTGENACLLIEEVQEFCGSNWAEEWLTKTIMLGRHANLAMIMSSQRPAQVARAITSQAHNLLVGQLFEFRDIEYIRQSMGDVADEIAKLKQFDFVFRRKNNPHLILDKYDFGAK